MNTIIALLVLACIVIAILWQFIHLPKHKLNRERIQEIKKYGLMHFTLKEHVPDILLYGLKPDSKKAMNFLERQMVWMYIANPASYEEKLREVHSKGKRSDYNAVIFIRDITDEDIHNMRWRKRPEAIVHIGTFKTSDMKAKDVKQILPFEKS